MAALLAFALPPVACAGAETEKTDTGAVAAVQPGAAVEADMAPDDEIVVTADRYGEAKVASESELGEGEIASQGADSIESLLARVAPFIGGGGEEPVLLINGKPAGFDRSVLSYPTEALDRLAVLKPEAAAQYGYPSGRRVVNLVLKKQFASLNLDAAANWATAGGQSGGSLSAARTAISGPLRWNVGARLGRDSALRKSARNVSPAAGVFDSTGFVSGLGGGEIDPALSAAAGEPVTFAAFPPVSRNGLPAIADFVATANARNAVDPRAFETFQSSRRNMALSIGVTRPIGLFTASLGLSAGSSGSDGRRGLPMLSVILPADSPWSPFAGDVLLTRPFAGERSLRSENRSDTLGLSVTLNGVLSGWQTSVAIAHSRSWGSNLFETGIDIARVQQRLDAGDPDFDPYGPWDDRLLLGGRNRTRSATSGARFLVQKAVVDLPAGPLTASFALNGSHARFQSRRSSPAGGPVTATTSKREQADGQISLSVPISRRALAEIGPLGDLTLDLSAGGQATSGSSLQKQFGGGVSWSPVPIIQLRGAVEYVETAPSFAQLDGPIVTVVNRVFDYRRGEIAEPVWITGGNPDLGRGSRRNLALNAIVRPFDDQTLSLTFAYRRTVAKGAISSFPDLTPAIEAAFPDRVTRDAEGRLIAVDARAINLARESDAALSSGIALRLPADRAAAAPGGARADPLQFSVALNHSVRLASELLTRPGAPAIDRLGDSGQSRHNVLLQVTAGKRGIGATLNGNWSSPARVSSGNRAFRFKPPMLFGLSMFVEPGQWSAAPKKGGLIRDLKVSLDIQNLFNGYRRVTFEDGSVPPGYSRDEVDPLGRTVRLTMRRKF